MKENLIKLDFINSLGATRSVPPSAEVLKAIEDITGYDMSYLFIANLKNQKQSVCKQDFSFFRSVEELKLVMDYSYLLEKPMHFAPFGVSYNFSKKRDKKKLIDWSIDTYGICFEGQFKNKNIIYAWDGDRDFINSWKSYEDFIGWLTT